MEKSELVKDEKVLPWRSASAFANLYRLGVKELLCLRTSNRRVQHTVRSSCKESASRITVVIYTHLIILATGIVQYVYCHLSPRQVTSLLKNGGFRTDLKALILPCSELSSSSFWFSRV